jgi:hypothetical protein
MLMRDFGIAKPVKMKNILLIVICVLIINPIIGQTLEFEIKIDTLKIIETKDIVTKEIEFEIPNGKLFISKASLINVWQIELSSWEKELNKNNEHYDWEYKNLKESEAYLNFVKHCDKLYFKFEGSEIDTFLVDNELPPTTDTLYYIENRLKEIACNLIDLGEFEIQINNNKIENVVKAKISEITKYYQTISTEFIVNDSIRFWKCPPTIHADYNFDK